jgi:hypothetical protein
MDRERKAYQQLNTLVLCNLNHNMCYTFYMPSGLRSSNVIHNRMVHQKIPLPPTHEATAMLEDYYNKIQGLMLDLTAGEDK